ncbi:hypothetical protein N2152v2_006464 [Parachlorella kessleri]
MSNNAVYGGDEVNAVVIDIGTHSVKAGYAGEDTPKLLFPSAVGCTSRDGGAAPAADSMEVDGQLQPGRQFYVGTHALSFRRDHMEVVSPFKDGSYHDWDAVEAIYDHTLRDQMRLRTQEHPVMLAEPSYNSREAREKMVQLMFEKYDVPGALWDVSQ